MCFLSISEEGVDTPREILSFLYSTRVKKRCTSCFASSLSLNSVKVKSFQSVSSQSDKTITVQNYKTVFSLHNDARNDVLSCHTMSNNVRRVFATRCFYNSNLSEQALKSVKCLNKRSQVSKLKHHKTEKPNFTATESNNSSSLNARQILSAVYESIINKIVVKRCENSNVSSFIPAERCENVF